MNGFIIYTANGGAQSFNVAHLVSFEIVVPANTGATAVTRLILSDGSRVDLPRDFEAVLKAVEKVLASGGSAEIERPSAIR